MKQVFHQLSFNSLLFAGGISLASLLSACSADTSDKNPDTVHVQVPWFNGSTYTLQKVDLHTIKDMVTLQGDSAKFLMAPGAQNGKLVGDQPKIRTMRTDDGTYIPEDFLSVQLLTLYAHFEKLANLDVELGLSQMISNWPRQQTIAVSVQTQDPTAGQMTTDNAMYTGDYDAFLFLPYTRPDLPFSVNAGVIGHEHFHSLFYQTFIQPLGATYPFSQPTAHPVTQILQAMGIPVVMSTSSQTVATAPSTSSTERDQYHAYLLRALNEGLADVWGWVYSGDSKFVQRSAAEYTNRNLDYIWSIALSSNQVNAMAVNSQRGQTAPMTIDGSVYQIGTVYAHRLWQSVQDEMDANGDSEVVERKKLAQGIMRAVGKLQTEFSKLDVNTKLDPVRPLQLIQAELPDLKIDVNVMQ